MVDLFYVKMRMLCVFFVNRGFWLVDLYCYDIIENMLKYFILGLCFFNLFDLKDYI